MEIEEVAGLDSNSNSGQRRGGGISPLPEIRSAVVTTDRQVKKANLITSFVLPGFFCF